MINVCFGMKRSGGHGVLQWAISGLLKESFPLFDTMTRGSLSFENNASPTRSYVSEWLARKGPEHRFLLIEHYPKFMHDLPSPVGNEHNHNVIIVLRNPINHMASLMAGSHPDFKAAIPGYEEAWRRALAAAGARDDGWNPILVRFDEWFSSKAERDALAQAMGFENRDIGREHVSPHGGGSSFEGRAMNGKATEMKLLSRWERFANDTSFLDRIGRMRDDIERVFGPLPDKLVSSS